MAWRGFRDQVSSSHPGPNIVSYDLLGETSIQTAEVNGSAGILHGRVG